MIFIARSHLAMVAGFVQVERPNSGTHEAKSAILAVLPDYRKDILIAKLADALNISTDGPAEEGTLDNA